jgi:hypothetical protein
MLTAGALDGKQELVVDDQRTTRHTIILVSMNKISWTLNVTAPSALESVVFQNDGTQQIAMPHVIPAKMANFDTPFYVTRDIDRDWQLGGLRNATGLDPQEIGGCATSGNVWKDTPERKLVIRDEPHCTLRVSGDTAPVGAPAGWEANTFAPIIEGNVVRTSSAGESSQGSVISSNAHASGKYYFEYDLIQWPSMASSSLGLTSVKLPRTPTGIRDGGGYLNGAGLFYSDFETASANHDAKFVQGSRVGFAVDLDQGFYYVHVDGTWTAGYTQRALARPPNGRPGDSAGYSIPRYQAMMPTVMVDTGSAVGIVTDPKQLRYPAPPGFVAGW